MELLVRPGCVERLVRRAGLVGLLVLAVPDLLVPPGFPVPGVFKQGYFQSTFVSKFLQPFHFHTGRPVLITPEPSEKFLKKSEKVMTWDLASICNFSVLSDTNFFLGRLGLACRAAHNCLVGTKKLLPAT